MLLPSTAAAQVGELYFPLDPGTRWIYQNTRFPGARAENAVLGFDDDGLTLFSRSGEIVRFQDEIDLIGILMEGGEVRTYYDFLQDQWLHADTDFCNNDRKMFVTSRAAVVDTPLATFTDCIQIEYEPGICRDAGNVVEWLAPDVGLVRWEYYTIAGLVAFELLEHDFFELKSEFIRGDFNGDARVGSADALAILEYLFLEDGANSCLSSADANDDGFIDIADPLYLLFYLFVQYNPPPPPQEACGPDPTLDELDCPTVESCI
jgi:hypothetical protein